MRMRWYVPSGMAFMFLALLLSRCAESKEVSIPIARPAVPQGSEVNIFSFISGKRSG